MAHRFTFPAVAILLLLWRQLAGLFGGVAYIDRREFDADEQFFFRPDLANSGGSIRGAGTGNEENMFSGHKIVAGEKRRTKATAEVAIFYNIFIPPGEEQNALRIVKEQLDARASQKHLANTKLYYTRIGDLNAPLPSCHNCVELQAVEEGNEVLTLQSMYEYCQSNVADRVIYIHNKGSFTRNPSNELLRKILTKAAFSPECSQKPLRDEHNEFDICSAHFTVFPIAHTIGNIFVAECDYVKKLIPPMQYEDAKRAVLRKARHGLLAEKPSHKMMYQFGHAWLGLGRYAAEHWVYSHPSVRPSDVYRFPLSYDTSTTPKNWEEMKLVRQSAPDGFQKWPEHDVHPWFLLPGRLYQYRELYSEMPPYTNWIYKAFL